MIRTVRPFLFLLALLLVAGCAANPRGERHERGPEDDATLVIHNQATSEMRIYAIVGAQRIRLGSVSPLGRERLRIPAHVVGLGRDLRFQALPLASNTVANSWNMYVRPGQTVTLTVPSTVR